MAVINTETGEYMPIVITNGDKLSLNHDVISIIANTENKMKELKAQYDEYRNLIKEEMEEHGIDKIDNDVFSIVYKPASTTMRLDTKELKELFPDEYEECLKPSKVSSSITFRFKKQKEK